MSSSASDARGGDGGRLGGARADFVASLGRKVGDARELLAALEEDAASRPAREELRRRLYALGSGARLLRFDAMARSLHEALTVLDRAALLGTVGEDDVASVRQVLDELPALAWGEAPPQPPAQRAQPAGGAAARPPVTVLVVGGAPLADALTEPGPARQRPFECERTDDAQSALELARAYAPDVVLLDADLPRARELVEALMQDPLTEPVPVLVVGTFRTADESARFAALGAAKALAKPAAPEVLRDACADLVAARDDRTMRVTLGEPTLEQLAARLADELKRALVGGVDAPARACRVPLGEGTEVLGALWGAIARIQDVVAQRTGGAVRFGGEAPEGAIALAPWLHHDVAASDRSAQRSRGGAADVRLNGRRVVVADDDPGVTWFISDLLRTAGCEVHEALDGATALDLAFRSQPELVVSDILMPMVDGFALSRALRRDIALRDTPVVLLSWKEDLLQRVRELGASAAAYMRKESDSRAILARVREVLRPRARIEARLRASGEVRGRLDGLSPRLLLELVGAVRNDARLAVRDATSLYEIEIRRGAPRRATRTASDGSYRSGARALASLLGVGSGRFVVSPSTEAVREELTGTLFEQLARPIATARGALAATTGPRTMQVERVLLDESLLEDTLAATPDGAREVIRRLARGTSPRQMLLGGDASPALLEDVLADLAARGVVRAVEGPDGADLLTPAVHTALAVLRGGAHPPRSLPPNARPSAAPAPAVVAAARAPSPAPGASAAAAVPSPAPEAAFTLSEPPPPPAASIDDDVGPPSSLEDAVIRELSERSPVPGAARISGAIAPLIEPSELRPRSSNPPANEVVPAPSGEERLPLPSIPPDAVVPATSSGEVPTVPPVPLVGADPGAMTPLLPTLADVNPAYAGPPPRRPEWSSAVGDAPTEGDAPSLSPLAVRSEPVRPPRQAATAAHEPPVERLPKSSPWGVLVAFGLLAIAVAAALYMSGHDGRDLAPFAPTRAGPAAVPAPAAPAAPAPSP